MKTRASSRWMAVSRCLCSAGLLAWASASAADSGGSVMAVKEAPGPGLWTITESGRPVLTYQYGTNEPGALLQQVSADNLKYARARGNYLHPLYGLQGEELTKDWPVDHPHHRGIYWAWPEVEWGTERGDLHALQRVFARPTGKCSGATGPDWAQLEAENLWRWEDRTPIVREVARIRAWRTTSLGRCVDLEFSMLALTNGVTLARRETKLYGGLNQRLAAVQDQQIVFHSDPAGATPRRAWADLSGTFPGGKAVAGLAVFQHPLNPDYPGDWVKYPDLNWFQPTFPAAETRFALSASKPLVLRYRLLVHQGRPDEAGLNAAWDAFVQGH